jgi:sulfate permease, SulP family
MQAMPIAAAYLPIVYSAAVYAPYLPLLTRLLFLANALIQGAVALCSSLPFAIGQVQDLGLIFLNAMTKDISQRMHGEDPSVVVATAILSCSLATAVLGLCLIIVGRCAPAATLVPL